jgi:uncharacterized protein (TIGR03083 family)
MVAAMQLAPRYDGPTILSISGPVHANALPCTRQRRRFETLLAGLTDEQWDAPSRCAGWSVRDVVVHLTGVNAFWQLTVQMGLAGTPTKFLGGFDPVATPAQMVSAVEAAPAGAVLAAFIASNDGLLGAIDGLDDEAWAALAEAPIGHVPVHVVVQHALWDAWVHERDVALPLGLPVAQEPDEVRACLVYAAAISPALGFAVGLELAGSLAIAADEPATSFAIDVTDSVAVTLDVEPAAGVPTLRGPAVELAEALSMRTPLPASAPAEWVRLRNGLGTAFDAAG